VLDARNTRAAPGLYPGLLFADKSPMMSLAAKSRTSALFDRVDVWPALAKWPERRYFQLCLAVSAMLFLIGSVFSVGSYQGDEYFQIVEFASSKLSLTNASDLTWEYHADMRPWLQPAIYAGVARGAALFGIHRPLTWLFLFRLVTAIAAWGSLWTLVAAGRHWVEGESQRRRLYAIAALLWLLPYLGARTSAETMSMAALCFGIGALEWRSNLSGRRGCFWLALLGGLAFGLCFEFRYASGVLPAGASLWYLWQSKARLSLFAGLTIGALLALGLGGVADWWGYGHLTFPAYWYVYQNFVLGRANDFGTSPFFAYLYLPIKAAGIMAPLALVLLIATVTAWLTRPRSALTWASVPYVVLLSVAPHKEVRFLFPLVPFLPFFVTFTFFSPLPVGERLASFVQRFASGLWLKLGYALNAFGLVCVVLLPQWSRAPLYAHIEDESFAANGPLAIAVVSARHQMPYEFINTRMEFLEPKNLQWIMDPSVPELEAARSGHKRFLALIDIPAPSSDAASWIRSQCRFVWSTYPRWLQPYDFNGWQERSYWWELYRCGQD
jgi:GPI mannosyltransferase 3